MSTFLISIRSRHSAPFYGTLDASPFLVFLFSNRLPSNVIPFDFLEQSQAKLASILLSTSVEKEGQLEGVRTRKKGDSFIRFYNSSSSQFNSNSYVSTLAIILLQIRSSVHVRFTSYRPFVLRPFYRSNIVFSSVFYRLTSRTYSRQITG